MGTGTSGAGSVFASPLEAEQAFYDALVKADLEALMRVWADDEDIVCIHPGDVRLTGLHQIRQSWQQILQHGSLTIELTRRHTMQTVMSSTHCSIECITVRGPEGLQQAYCDVTNVFHKGRAGWRMVLHHASPAAPQAGLHDAQDFAGTLH